MTDSDAAIVDIDDLSRADTLILFSDEHRGVGRHIEFGAALITGRRLFIVGEEESVFHCWPGVIVAPTVDALISLLRPISSEGE